MNSKSVKSVKLCGYHLDLYNSVQAEQLIEKSAEALELLPSEISELTSALEDYFGCASRNIYLSSGYRWYHERESARDTICC